MKLFLVLALVVAFAWGAVLPQREAGGQSCMLCEFVIQTAEGYLSSNASEQEIIKFLEQACGLVPAPYSDECRLMLEENGSHLIEWLIQKENPEVVCAALKLCPQPLHQNVALLQALKTQPFQKALHTIQGHKDTFCGLCKLGASVVESELESQTTLAAIAAKLKLLCEKVPPVWTAQCSSLVDKVPAYIAAFERKEKPALVCAQLGFCPSA